MNSYASIGNFGQSSTPSPMSNPLAVCATSELDSGFSATLGGTNLMGPNSAQCQRFMGNYCASEWNGVCEYLSKDTSRPPNFAAISSATQSGSCYGSGLGNELTKGQTLLRNTCQNRFLKSMSSNCVSSYQSFDPSIADSPLIRTFYAEDSGQCIPIYDVDEKNIDNDIVMNKLLIQPWVALDMLVNIYRTRVNMGTLEKLRGTKLYNFFMTQQFQQILGTKVYG